MENYSTNNRGESNLKKKLDKRIEISSWIIVTILLIKFIPRDKIREAHTSFFFKQFITWLFGLLVVEKKFISYPNRMFFKHANKTSFTFEYFVYPGLCTLFNLYYPLERSNIIKILYYLLHTSIITVFEALAVKYTNLINYKKWTWYYSFITVWLTYYLSHNYHKWYFKRHENN